MDAVCNLSYNHNDLIAVSIEDLDLKFKNLFGGDSIILQRASLSVPIGSIYGLLGPSGKLY